MKRKAKPQPLPITWVVSEEYQLSPRRRLDPTSIVRIKGVRGTFKFRQAVTKGDGTVWLDVIGGPTGYTLWRSIRPDQISKVMTAS